MGQFFPSSPRLLSLCPVEFLCIRQLLWKVLIPTFAIQTAFIFMLFHFVHSLHILPFFFFWVTRASYIVQYCAENPVIQILLRAHPEHSFSSRSLVFKQLPPLVRILLALDKNMTHCFNVLPFTFVFTFSNESQPTPQPTAPKSQPSHNDRILSFPAKRTFFFSYCSLYWEKKPTSFLHVLPPFTVLFMIFICSGCSCRKVNYILYFWVGFFAKVIHSFITLFTYMCWIPHKSHHTPCSVNSVKSKSG